MQMQIVAGWVRSDGQIQTGKGFSVSHTADTGLYDISFQPAFAAIYGMSVTQVWPAKTGKTLDNAVLNGLYPARAEIHTGDATGASCDRDFSFVAVGVVEGASLPSPPPLMSTKGLMVS